MSSVKECISHIYFAEKIIKRQNLRRRIHSRSNTGNRRRESSRLCREDVFGERTGTVPTNDKIYKCIAVKWRMEQVTYDMI